MFAVCPRFLHDNSLMPLGEELFCPYIDPRELSLSRRPLRNAALRESEVHNADKEFRIRLDLHHFRPEEVKIISDNQKVTIRAKHEEIEDNHGLVSREVTRIYLLPEDVDPTSVTSTMNSQGVLSIRAEKQALEAPKERAIFVEFKN